MILRPAIANPSWDWTSHDTIETSRSTRSVHVRPMNIETYRNQNGSLASLHMAEGTCTARCCEQTFHCGFQMDCNRFAPVSLYTHTHAEGAPCQHAHVMQLCQSCHALHGVPQFADHSKSLWLSPNFFGSSTYILWNRMQLYVVAVATLQWPLASVASAQKWWSTINCPWQTAGAGYGQHTACTFCTQPDLRNFGPSHAGEVPARNVVLFCLMGVAVKPHIFSNLWVRPHLPPFSTDFTDVPWFRRSTLLALSSSQFFSTRFNSSRL